MDDLGTEVDKYLAQRRNRKPIVIEVAGETYGCDPNINEMLVPMIQIFVPLGFIRKYNQIIHDKNSVALPDPNEFWKFLYPHLIEKGLVAVFDEFDTDYAIAELLDWPHSAEYIRTSDRNGVLLFVKGDYDPYRDIEEL